MGLRDHPALLHPLWLGRALSVVRPPRACYSASQALRCGAAAEWD